MTKKKITIIFNLIAGEFIMSIWGGLSEYIEDKIIDWAGIKGRIIKLIRQELIKFLEVFCHNNDNLKIEGLNFIYKFSDFILKMDNEEIDKLWKKYNSPVSTIKDLEDENIKLKAELSKLKGER